MQLARLALIVAAPEPVRWLRFLGELWPDDPDAVLALQELFGYVLSGRNDQHKIGLLIGPKRSGKGTIARVLAALIGPQNVAGPTLAQLGSNFGLSPLIGKTLAVISDARLSGTSYDISHLLAISGGDRITIDRKYQEPWTGTLSARFLILSNEPPAFHDPSGAIISRFLVITTTESFFGRENPHLTEELLDELPGILGWSFARPGPAGPRRGVHPAPVQCGSHRGHARRRLPGPGVRGGTLHPGPRCHNRGG